MSDSLGKHKPWLIEAKERAQLGCNFRASILRLLQIYQRYLLHVLYIHILLSPFSRPLWGENRACFLTFFTQMSNWGSEGLSHWFRSHTDRHLRQPGNHWLFQFHCPLPGFSIFCQKTWSPTLELHVGLWEVAWQLFPSLGRWHLALSFWFCDWISSGSLKATHASAFWLVRFALATSSGEKEGLQCSRQSHGHDAEYEAFNRR